MMVRRSSLLVAGVLLAAGVSLCRTVVRASVPIADPIPDDPAMARFGIVVRELATFPASEPVPEPGDRRLMRHARINHLGEIPDGTRRLYVPDLNGTLYVLEHGMVRPYLDVKKFAGANFFSGRGVGSGFGFVTFHPEFGKNGRFYTVHTEAVDTLTTRTADLVAPAKTVLHSVLVEWTADEPLADTFAGRQREVLRLGFAGYVHGIQQIDFNPTARPGDEDYGLLYIAAGDGGIGVSTNVPQDLTVPQGKILRIDPAGTNSANGRYGIPPSNPFVDSTGAVREIYAYGMRDPHRFSWDPGGRHRMFLGHIGEKDIEAIYDVRPGDNLGWSEREGPFVRYRDDRCNLHALPADDAKYGYDYPVAAYDHDPPPGYPCGADVGHAIAGGFVYRGRAAPELRGKYVFTDIADGRVMYVEEQAMRRGGALAPIHELPIFEDAREITMPIAANDTRVDLRLGRDGAGELYLLSKANGKVWKIVGTRSAAGSSPVHPAVLPALVARYDAKTGIHARDGASGLRAFSNASGATIMGWFELTGSAAGRSAPHESIRLAAILSGDSAGHGARASLELTSVGGELRLAAAGQRIDGGAVQTYAVAEPWQTLLPTNVRVFLAATFDFSRGVMALYRNGKPIAGSNLVEGDPWGVSAPGSHRTSPADPRGISVGDSYPQDARAANRCECRADDVMFVARVLSPLEVNQQYRRLNR